MLKIALLKDGDFSEVFMARLLDLLNNSQSTIAFENYDKPNLKHLSAEIEYQDELTFKRLQSLPPVYFNIAPSSNYPVKEEVMAWDDLVNVGKKWREENPDKDVNLVIYLTTFGNDKNWFSGMDENLKNGFVKTTHWHYYFGDVNVRFPVAFEILSLVYQHVGFKNRDEALKRMHTEPRGCLMDLSPNKDDVILKMRCADICYECIENMENKNANPILMQGIVGLMDKIRLHVLFRKRAKFFKKMSKIEIRGDYQRIYLVDFGELELELNPKERTLYIFFLNHPQGVRLADLHNYRDELWEIYSSISKATNLDSIKSSFELLLNPEDDNVFQVLSRIRKKIMKLLGECAKPYLINGERGGKYYIGEDKNLVGDSAIDAL